MSDLKELSDSIKKVSLVHDVFIEAQKKRFDEFDKRLGDLQDRIEDTESRKSQPGKTATDTRQGREHKNLFEAWIRKPRDHGTNERLSNFQADLERKGVTIGSTSGGGYAVPEELASDVARLELKYSPVRSLVGIRQIGTSDFRSLVDLNGAEAGWVSESGGRTETSTPLLREVVPTHGELYAYPKASNWSLDDIYFNVQQWLTDSVARAFAIAEGQAVINGDGSSKPTGMLHTTPVTTSDEASPARAAAAYQYIFSTDPASSPPAFGVDPDKLIDLVYTLNSAYRMNGSWVMNSLTAATVRKLKDANGVYVWQPGLVSGQPERLLGYPVAIWEDLDDVGNNKFPIAFGDWSRGYELVDRVGLRVTVDEVTTPGFTKFYVRKRVGGSVRDNNAIKWLKTATS